MKDHRSQLNALFQRQRARLVAALEILAGQRPRAPAQPIRTEAPGRRSAVSTPLTAVHKIEPPL